MFFTGSENGFRNFGFRVMCQKMVSNFFSTDYNIDYRLQYNLQNCCKTHCDDIVYVLKPGTLFQF